MAKQGETVLADGVTLSRKDGEGPLELTIRAGDADELAWRIHDLIPLIQSGELARRADKLAGQDPPK